MTIQKAGRLDLRRRRAALHLSELILMRIEGLPPPDRELLCTIYGRGRAVAEVCRLTGRTDVWAVRKRVRQLSARVLRPEFAFVLAMRDKWSPTRREVATRFFVRGQSFRQIAQQMGVSYYVVRMHGRVVQELAARAGGAGGRP